MANLTILQNSPTIFWSHRLSSWVNPYHDLETRIGKIAAKNLSTQQKDDLQRAFKLAHSWTWPAGRMQALLKNIPKESIQELIFDLLQKRNEKEITKHLHLYLSLLDQATLLEMSGLTTLENATKKFHSKSLIKDEMLSNSLEKESRAILKGIGIELKYFIHHFLDIIISLLGLNEVGEGKHSRYSQDDGMDEYKAVHKIEAYGRLIGYPALLFGVIYANIQFKALAITLTTLSVISIILGLIAYLRYWKPCPKQHHGIDNLMTERLNSSRVWTYARQEILSEIEKAFMEKKGVILVGEPGAGKSMIAPSMADKIAEGSMCGFIKDPQLFSCGASKFNNFSHEGPSLDAIASRFKQYRDQVIFFFDEFHSFFKPNGIEGNSKTEDIKIFCDKFKNVIGTTTTKEFKEHIEKHITMEGRRIVVIQVSSMEDKSLKIMLSQFLQAKHPTINLDDQPLDYLIQRAKDFNSKTSKIDAAQTLLNRAVHEIESKEFKELEIQIIRLEEEKNLIKQELFHSKIENDDDELTNKLISKEAEIARLKEELKQKNQQVERMRKIELYYLQLKGQMFRMTDPTIQLTSKPRLAQQWIEVQAKIKVVGDFIENKRKELNLPVGLTKELIDKIIKERK